MMNHEQVPGDVYLCQVNECISCGACCGLYNVQDTSRSSLDSILRERSQRFANVARDIAAIEAFASETRRLEPRQRPFKDFHHCPYLGLIGPGSGRVGCLLHPMVDGNGGVDFRGLSYYGGMACRTYFCPTTRELPARWKQVVRSVIDDWHFFGLIITENKLLNAFFNEIESRLGHPVTVNLFSQAGPASQCLKELLRIKCGWPFRPPGRMTGCHFFFNDKDYPKPVIDYDRLAMPVSRYDTILRELVSEFKFQDQVRSAEQLVSNKITALVRVLAAGPPVDCKL
jgi:hypothetical protein